MSAPLGTGHRPLRQDLTDRRVLVVEDDSAVREVVARYLVEAGLLVDEVGDGFAALRMLDVARPDLVVLDRMLPGVDGLEIARRIRARVPVPVIMLTALGSTDQRIEGLEAGVDDYVIKPFSPRELVLRVQTVLRRSVDEYAPEAPFTIGLFALDPSTRTVRKADAQVPLSTREYELLAFLLKHPRHVFTREQLLKAVWAWDYGDRATVTVTVRRVREKIEDDPAAPRFVMTEWGVGYRFDP
jgi:DNA-binding response OmpR family regulator